MIKKILKNKSGTILVFVLFMFASIMVVIASLLALTGQNYNGVVTQQLNARAYYLTLESADIAVAALLKNPPDNNYYSTLLAEYYNSFKNNKAYEDDTTIDYSELGKSEITVKFEKDDKLTESTGSDVYWAVIYIATTIPDYRVNIEYNNEASPEYKLYYQLKMLVDNTDKRVFGIITEDDLTNGIAA